MGLFDFLKKKKEEQKSFVATNTNANHAGFDPWSKETSNVKTQYRDTDYSNAVFLNMLSRKPTAIGSTPDAYPRYVSYKLGIIDPISKHRELVQNGFLRNAMPMEILDTFKVPELKDILDQYGIVTKSKKRADLLLDIQNNIDINLLTLPLLYCVSEKGQDFMEQHEDLIKLFNNRYSISLEEYQVAKASADPQMRYNDIIWMILNSKMADRNNALYRAQFLQDENRLVDALSWYLTVLYYDVNEDCDDELAPGIVKEILSLKEHFNNEMIDRCFCRVVLRKLKVSNAAFTKLVDDLFAGSEINLKNYK